LCGGLKGVGPRQTRLKSSNRVGVLGR
jgi:hypothetical protein